MSGTGDLNYTIIHSRKHIMLDFTISCGNHFWGGFAFKAYRSAWIIPIFLMICFGQFVLFILR